MPDLIGSNRKMLASLGPDLRGACEEAYTSPGPAQAGTTNEVPGLPGALPSWHHVFRQDLDDLRTRGMHRRLRSVDSGMGRTLTREGRRDVLNLASNDYLGLAADPRLAQAVADALGRFGWGSGGSRLICGHTSLHAELERALAAFKRTEAALVLPTGYMANLAAVRALAAGGDAILLDKLNHASIIDAADSCGADVRVFPHRNYDKLERLLRRYARARRRVIVTDTVFSMDGDLADLRRLVALKARYDAILIVDEAHATGVLGPSGRGVAELQSVEADVDVTVGTLSKALGGLGGFIAGPAVLIESLVNHARPFIFTTALPAAACGAALCALGIVESEPWRRGKVLDLARSSRTHLTAAGWDTAGSQTQIVPVVVGQADESLRLADHLLEQGIFAPAIRPPAVPAGSARLRISLTAAHEPGDVTAVVRALGSAGR